MDARSFRRDDPARRRSGWRTGRAPAAGAGAGSGAGSGPGSGPGAGGEAGSEAVGQALLVALAAMGVLTAARLAEVVTDGFTTVAGFLG